MFLDVHDHAANTSNTEGTQREQSTIVHDPTKLRSRRSTRGAPHAGRHQRPGGSGPTREHRVEQMAANTAPHPPPPPPRPDTHKDQDTLVLQST